MQKLNLPPYEYKIKEFEGKNLIFDPVRKKYVVLSPEEWVRQHIIDLLVNQLKYSKSLIKVEGGLSYNHLQKRSDILVFDKKGKPYLLIECKAADVPISQKTIAQAAVYNRTLLAPFVALSNGIKTFCFEVNLENGQSTQLKAFPVAP